MPLVKVTLETALRKIMDPDYVGFVGFPADNVSVANTWGTIVDDYAKLIVPPSTSSAPAKSAFMSAMIPISSSAQNGLAQLVSAFSAYAAALAIGMQPLFTATPPTSPINIVPVTVLGLGGASGEVTSKALASIIHLWFKTGLSTNNSSGASINWN